MTVTVQLIALDLDGTCAVYEPRLGLYPAITAWLRGWIGEGRRWVLNSDRFPQDLETVALGLPLTPNWPPPQPTTQHTSNPAIGPARDYTRSD